jgi:tripeptide aminopeptidase
MINERRLVDSFKRLVSIDSLSLKEGKVIKYLEKELKVLGLKPYQAGKPKDGEAYNLAVDLPGDGPRVLLNAHVDTVQPGTAIKPIQRKGIIKTNGTTILGADDKAGVAVILEVLKVIKENKLAHPYLRVIFTVAEEIGLLGAMVVPRKLLDVDFGITLDHGEVREIVNKAPSQQNITATIIGKAAHAGVRPEDGINAIKVASVAIAKMKLGRIDKETTANVGVIQGGKATNIIPERVEIKGEARSHSPAKLKKQINHMRKALLDACCKAKARLKIKIGVMYKSFEVKKTAKALKVAFSAARKAGLKPVLKQTGGGSDANIFNAAGVPTINVGVGMHKVHTTEEFVKIKEMAKGTEIVLNMIKECSK